MITTVSAFIRRNPLKVLISVGAATFLVALVAYKTLQNSNTRSPTEGTQKKRQDTNLSLPAGTAQKKRIPLNISSPDLVKWWKTLQTLANWPQGTLFSGKDPSLVKESLYIKSSETLAIAALRHVEQIDWEAIEDQLPQEIKQAVDQLIQVSIHQAWKETWSEKAKERADYHKFFNVDQPDVQKKLKKFGFKNKNIKKWREAIDALNQIVKIKEGGWGDKANKLWKLIHQNRRNFLDFYNKFKNITVNKEKQYAVLFALFGTGTDISINSKYNHVFSLFILRRDSQLQDRETFNNAASTFFAEIKKYTLTSAPENE